MVVDPQRDIDRVLDLAAAPACGSPTCWRPTCTTTTSPAAWSWPGAPARPTSLPGRQRRRVRPHRRRRRRRARGRARCGCGCCTPPGTPTTTSATSWPTRAGRCRRCSPAGRCSTAPPAAPTWSAPSDTDELTHAQYHSVRRLAAELPADAAVFPTHGFGSFCSATPTSGDASTVGEQARVNPALTLDEQDYVDTLLAGLDAYPAYYAHMGPINRRGPAPVDLSPARAGRPRRAAPPASRPASGWSTCASAPRSPPGTWPARSASSCRPTSSPTWAGSTPRAPR